MGATECSATTYTLETTSVREAYTLPDLAISCYLISGIHYFYKSEKKLKGKAFLTHVPNFSFRESRRKETKLAEEKCWAITQTTER